MKKIIITTSLCLLLISCGTTKKTVSSVPLDATKHISSITQSELTEHLTIIASDKMEGRDTGSKG